MEPITNKPQMYELLRRGSLGNTIPQYMGLTEWASRDKSLDIGTHWGIRSMKPGGGCDMYVSEDNVTRAYVNLWEFTRGEKLNISSMIDAHVTVLAWVEVVQIEGRGLVVRYYNLPSRGTSWRQIMPSKGKEIHGTLAKMYLSRMLNPSSLDDIYSLLEMYPDHVIELSVTETCIGIYRGRNYVTWEVRLY